MLKTPNYKIEDETVYPPAEDTFLLLDALERDAESLSNLRPTIVVEIGCGSGVVIAFLYQLLKLSDETASTLFVGTDLNICALESTRFTALLNDVPNTNIELINCDLVGPVMHRFTHRVDILLFNPPYVPSEMPAHCVEDFYYAGGKNGREVIDRAVKCAANILSSEGIFYLVALKANNVEDTRAFAKHHRLHCQIALERRCGIEHLYVLKFTRIL